MKLSLRRLPQSRIRSTAPSRREPYDVRSSTDKKSYPLSSGGPRLSPTGLWLIFCKMPLSKLPDKSQFTAFRAKEAQTSPQKISPYSGGVGGIDSPHAPVAPVARARRRCPAKNAKKVAKLFKSAFTIDKKCDIISMYVKVPQRGENIQEEYILWQTRFW